MMASLYKLLPFGYIKNRIHRKKSIKDSYTTESTPRSMSFSPQRPTRSTSVGRLTTSNSMVPPSNPHQGSLRRSSTVPKIEPKRNSLVVSSSQALTGLVTPSLEQAESSFRSDSTPSHQISPAASRDYITTIEDPGMLSFTSKPLMLPSQHGLPVIDSDIIIDVSLKLINTNQSSVYSDYNSFEDPFFEPPQKKVHFT